MRGVTRLLAAVLLFVGSAAAPQGQERGMGGVGITVFVDSSFRGENASFNREVRSLRDYRLDNRISSLRVAPGEYWEVCEDADFRGRCQVFYDTESDLRRVGWDNRISSLRRVRDDGGWGGSGGGGTVPRGGVVLYSDTRFRGDRRDVRSSVPDMVSLGFNDRARSLRLGGGAWEVCRDSGYRGCEIVYDDVDDLADLGLSKRISSLRPYRNTGGGGQRGRLELFAKTRHGGDSIALESARGSLGSMAGRAESLRLSGTWEICDAENFRGRCIRISRNVTDLEDIGWKDRIRSARPR